MGRGLHTVLLCALLRHASVGSREQVQPPLPPPRRRPFWGGGGGGRSLGSGGAEGRACGSPAGGGAGGGVGGPPPRPLSGLSGRGQEEWGGPSGPLATPPDGRGGGAVWQSRPRGPAIGWGVAPFPCPPLVRAEPPCRPSLGPLIPPAVFARRWPAGGGHVG